MPVTHLDDRAILNVSGEEAGHFLQNLITADLDTLFGNEVRVGALLSPQGKILFDFLVSRDGEHAFRLECRSDIVDDLMRRLMLYRLRAKVRFEKAAPLPVAVMWQGEGATGKPQQGWLSDSRFVGDVGRRYQRPVPEATASFSDWDAYRVAHGVAESGADYPLGEAFPHDVLLDQMNGIGFQKGCYVGQEVVSRMQHRGSARRRVLIAHSQTMLPAPGTSIEAGGRALGTLGSTAGMIGLAIVRIDRVKDAMDRGETIMAGDKEIALRIPEWARFGFPQDATETGTGEG